MKTDQNDYYDKNANFFIKNTLNVDASPLYEKFCPYLKNKAHILDAGCGSGRDIKYFLEKKYKVTAFDASKTLVEFASKYCNHKILCMHFQDMSFEEEFDGIWSSASLLHISKQEIEAIFLKFIKALKIDGVWFLSFKYGNKERYENGRFFNDYNEKSLQNLLKKFSNLEIINLWKSRDLRKGYEKKFWINVICKKINSKVFI